jgi:hypothetical protein
MKRIAALLTLAVLGVSIAAQGQSGAGRDPARLIALWHQENENCRGGSEMILGPTPRVPPDKPMMLNFVRLVGAMNINERRRQIGIPALAVRVDRACYYSNRDNYPTIDPIYRLKSHAVCGYVELATTILADEITGAEGRCSDDLYHVSETRQQPFNNCSRH